MSTIAIFISLYSFSFFQGLKYKVFVLQVEGELMVMQKQQRVSN
jgi:hypothetical protein